MFPYVTIAGRGFPSYGIAAVAGFLLGLIILILTGRGKKKERTDPLRERWWRDAADCYLIGVAGALIGGKLCYLLVMLPQILRDIAAGYPFSWFFERYLTSGMVFYGGLFGAILFSFLTAKYLGVSFRALYPLLVPSLTIVAGFGRIGCFLTGCCYGVETTGPIYVVFHHSIHAPNEVPLFPTQLFEAGFDFFLFFLLRSLSRTRHWDKLLSLYLFLYAVFRFILEFFRGDEIRGRFFLSTSQWISIAILFVLFLLKRKKKVPIMD